MPFGTTVAVATEGAAFGLFPIIWIIWNAIWIYNMTVETGHFAVLRRSFASISDDQRIQAVIIAFCFGALLEALAGFGAPVAITAVMLIAVGFKPLQAAAVALVANTAPVAFGAIATPIVTLASLTELPQDDLGAMVGRQTPLLALFVPLILVGMVDGRRGVRAVWPAAMVAGITFAIGQFVCANYISVELTDIVASLLSVGAMVVFLRIWQPADPLTGTSGAPGRPAIAGAATHDAAHEAAVRRREGTGRGHTRRHREGLRAVRDHHRRVRARAVGTDQGPPGQGCGRVHLARHRRHPERQGRAADRDDVQVRLAGRARHAAAGQRVHHDGRAARLPRRARCTRTGRCSTSSSGRR